MAHLALAPIHCSGFRLTVHFMWFFFFVFKNKYGYVCFHSCMFHSTVLDLKQRGGRSWSAKMTEPETPISSNLTFSVSSVYLLHPPPPTPLSKPTGHIVCLETAALYPVALSSHVLGVRDGKPLEDKHCTPCRHALASLEDENKFSIHGSSEDSICRGNYLYLSWQLSFWQLYLFRFRLKVQLSFWFGSGH